MGDILYRENGSNKIFATDNGCAQPSWALLRSITGEIFGSSVVMLSKGGDGEFAMRCVSIFE
jgi:hypothetical protein